MKSFPPPEDAYTVHLVKQRVYEMEDDIKVDHHTGTLGEGVDWICLAQDSDEWPAAVSTAMNTRIS